MTEKTSKPYEVKVNRLYYN